jgi:adhesin transport system outer membrane protein
MFYFIQYLMGKSLLGCKKLHLRNLLSFTAAFFLAVGVSAGPCYAQSLGELLPGSLGELLPGVVKNDDFVKAARSELEAKKQEEKVVFGQWYPTLAASGSYGYEVQNGETTEDVNLASRDLNLSVTQLLWDFGNVNSQVIEKRMEVAEVASRHKDARQVIMRDAILAYINILRFYQSTQIAERAIEIIIEQGRLEKQRLKIGAGTSTDVLKAQSKLASQEDLRVSLLKVLRTALNAYRKTTKSDPPAVKNMVRPRLPLDLIPASVEEAIKIALTSNPLLRSSRLISIINRQKVITSRASSFFPKLEGVVDTKFKRNFSGTVGDKRETISKVQMSYSFNLGGTAINTLRQSKETASQLHSIYAKSRNKTEESVRNAWDKLRTSQERVQILTDGLAIHSKSLELVQKDRKKGKSTVLEVLDAIAQLTAAQGGLAVEEGEVLSAAYELLYAMGRLDLAAVGGVPLK